MNFYYGNGGFYPMNDKARYAEAGSWPATGFEITENARNELLEGERNGLRIVPDETGRPVLVNPEDIAPTVPKTVSPRQARLALLQAGKLNIVTEIIAQSDEATRITWDYATSIERDSPVVEALAAALGLDDGELDELFKLAATL